ncbi:Ig-like domain repeat protein [Pimelobacter simplex]|uniref:Ig-like domain-containing protein n=1 Tax=Nocardioides simplex TaxID=2045 RepID=UPI003AAC57A8
MKTVRRGIAGIAAAALTAAGLSVLGVATAPAAHAATGVLVENATLRWGVSNESNNAGFAPGTWNLFSAGKLGDPTVGGVTLKTADQGATWSNNKPAGWTNHAGNVTVEDLQAGGGYAPTTFDGTRQNSAGASTAPASSNVFAETQLVFRNGTGRVDAAANTASVQWDGDATVVYYSGMTFFYVSDPELTVNADGSGEVTATLDGYGTDMEDQTKWVDLPATEVTLATLTGVAVEDLGLTTTPAYRGVEYTAPAGATAQVRTGADWGSFPQSFVDFVQTTGGGPYWYSSGGAADAKKPTLPLDISWTKVGPPAVQVSKTTLLPSGAYEVTVTGTGFDPNLATGTRPPLAGKPGGTYVVFGKFATNWRPSLTAPSSARKVGNQKWAVLAGDMGTIGGPAAGAVELTPQGTFTAKLTVDKAAMDAAATDPSLVNYGVYTYPGSGGNAPTYETYTPITFAAAPGTATATVTTAPTRTTDGSADITVADAEGGAGTGSVDVKVEDGSGTEVASETADLTAGKATVTLPKGAPGDYTLEVLYTGNTNITEARTDASYAIGRATGAVSTTVTKKPTPAATGTATIKITSDATATGDVQLQVKRANGTLVTTTSAQLQDGAAPVTLPKLAPGRYALVASYTSDGTVESATSTTTLDVAKVASRVSAAWTKKPTARKAGKLKVSVTAPGITATGKVTVVIKNAKGKKVRTLTGTLAKGVVTLKAPKLKAGKYQLAVTYAGDSQLTGASSKAKVTAKRR